MNCLLLLSLLLPIVTLANSAPDHNWNVKHPGCLDDAQANELLQIWMSFFVKIDPAVAERTLASDFQFFSDSANFLGLYDGKAVRYPVPKFDMLSTATDSSCRLAM